MAINQLHCFSLSTTTTTATPFSLRKPCHHPLSSSSVSDFLFLLHYHTSFPSKSSLTLLNLHHTALKTSTCHAVKTKPLLLSEEKKKVTTNSKNNGSVSSSRIEEKGGWTKAENFAMKIRKTPLAKRPEYVRNVIKSWPKMKNISSLNNLMMGLLLCEEVSLAMDIFNQELPVLGMKPNLKTYSVMMRCHCFRNEPGEAKKVLDRMLEDGLRPNVVTFTTLISSFCSSGNVERALDVLEVMGRFGCEANVCTYNCLLKGLCFVGRIDKACEMLMVMMKREGDNERKPDIFSYTIVMDGLCKVGRSDEAMELFNKAVTAGLTPSAVTYNTLFQGFCKQGEAKKGISVARLMKANSCQPDYISYSTLLHGLMKLGEFLAGYWIYREMLEVNLRVNERMMNTLLRGLCRESWKEEERLEKVYEVFDKIKSWSYTIYPESCYVVINRFCAYDANSMGRVLVALNEMVTAGYFPRMLLVSKIMGELCEEGSINEALSILTSLSSNNRIPSKLCYDILIGDLIKRGKVLVASCVYGAALKLGVSPQKKPLYVS